MRRLLATGFVVTLLGLLLLQTIAPAVTAQELEIAYDSGTPGASVSLPYAQRTWAGGMQPINLQYEWIGNTMLAVRFTPDKSTLQMLLAVRFYIMGDLESFNVWVLDSNRIFMAYLPPSDPGDVPAQIQSPVYSWTVTPASIGWVTLNVTSALNPIFLTDDFYVAIGFTVAEKPALGVDTTGARSNRSWFVDNQSDTGWVAYSPYAQQHGLPDGNLMIRAVTSPIFDLVRNTMTTTTMHAAQSHEFPLAILFPAGTVLAILAVAAVGVRQVRKRRHVGSGT